ncbi:MAG: hypothetical protein ABI690_35800 [Chloroflexota bacterium]
MPLPMVHFAVAVQLGERSHQFPSADFLLGSIAPDAVHMRPEFNYRDKLVTHFLEPADTPNHAFVHELYAKYADSPAPYPVFTAGYTAHLLTDRLWSRTVSEPLFAQLPPDINDAARRKLYYEETDQVDCNLFQHIPWQSKVWAIVAEAHAPDYRPLLSATEIDLWRERTMHWFEDPAHDPHITPRYITDKLVENFIIRAVQYVETHFYAWHIFSPFA